MTSPHSTNPTSNISPSSVGFNPFILGNIALLAGVPWLLALSMAGLAVGDPVFPAWFEIFLLGFPEIAFVTWLQWQQPFSPFSLWIVSKPTESLSDRDRQVLTLVKQHSNGWYVTGWIATAVAIVISVIFCKMYITAPLAQTIAPFPAWLRLFGIVWAEIFFLLSNVLLQSGISALRIKLTAESELNSMKPFAVEKIKNSFTNIGWKSPQLLKFFEENAIADEIIESPIKEPVEIVSETEIAAIEPSNTVLETESEEIISEIQVETNQEIIEEVEEVEELEIIAIVVEESVIELNSEPEIVQLIEESLIETLLDQEIIQESGDLDSVDVSDDAETLLVVTDTTETDLEEPEIAEAEAVLEVFDIGQDALFVEEVEDSGTNTSVFEKAEELEAFEISNETSEEPELAFLDIPNSSLEPEIEDQSQPESNAESSEPVLDEQITENGDELEFIETVEDSEAETFSNTTSVSTEKRELDFFKKPRKTGGASKKLGFGKSAKRDNIIVSMPETLDPEEIEPVKSPEQNAIANNDLDTANLDAIAKPIEQDLAAPEIKTQDFDDELDELIAFNTYVENILEKYLEDPEDSEAIAEVDEIAEPTTDEPTTEQEPKNPQYLVQEFLVDKFLARLEELNIADKANKLSIEQAKENISELNSEVDEFADLEALLDRKPLSDSPDLDDLSDRNS